MSKQMTVEEKEEIIAACLETPWRRRLLADSMLSPMEDNLIDRYSIWNPSYWRLRIRRAFRKARIVADTILFDISYTISRARSATPDRPPLAIHTEIDPLADDSEGVEIEGPFPVVLCTKGRHEWISVNAYYRAEKAGWPQGCGLAFWLAAEAACENNFAETMATDGQRMWIAREWFSGSEEQ